jgi:TRAP-type mannitol/chloroaromatic compound transport system permease large subunit
MTAMVGFITLAASYFGSVFVAIGGNAFVTELASGLPGGNYGIVLACLAIVFFLGMFLDTIAIVVICAPIFTTLLKTYGIDPMWFAICFMVEYSGLPYAPFGFSLFLDWRPLLINRLRIYTGRNSV